jgi:hypothetical protein
MEITQPEKRKRRKRRPNFRPAEGFHWHEVDERYRSSERLRDFVTLLMVHQACANWLRKKGLLFEDAFRERQDYKNRWRQERRAELKEAA